MTSRPPTHNAVVSRRFAASSCWSGPLIGDERRGLVGLPRRCGTPPPASRINPVVCSAIALIGDFRNAIATAARRAAVERPENRG